MKPTDAVPHSLSHPVRRGLLAFGLLAAASLAAAAAGSAGAAQAATAGTGGTGGSDAAAAAAAAPSGPCGTEGELHFVCGPVDAEDLVLVPGTRWIITSGMVGGGRGGLFLVDDRSRSVQKFQVDTQMPARHDASTYPACSTPPAAATLNAHGLSLRAHGAGDATLYVVGHGGREAIEVFDVRWRGAGAPTLTWTGCVPMPAAADSGTNAVTSLADGTLYITVFTRAGTTMVDLFSGRSTGDVYRWRPGSAAPELLPGLSLDGDNGIAASADGRELYLNLSGTRQLLVLSTADPSHPLRKVQFKNMMPDNVHLGPDGQLIEAGMRYDEPACGGPMIPVNGKVSDCRRGEIVALVDPHTLAVHVLYDGRARVDFGGVATGLVVGQDLWLSSFQTAHIAYVRLPRGALTGH